MDSFLRAYPAALSIFIFSLVFCQLCLAHVAKKALVPAVIAFGDSIIDPGNNNQLNTVFKADFLPYGIDFVGQKPTGRFCDGKITTDFIASGVGVKELLPAYTDPELSEKDLLTGVSFASAGTGYDIITSELVSVIPMLQQLEMFKEYKEKLKSIAGEKKAARIISESLYIVCAGSNDVVSYFTLPFRKLHYHIPSYAEVLMKTASSFVQELVQLGAKRIGIMGIPPIGCVPSQRTLAGGLERDCVADRNQLAQLYNSKLTKELRRLNSTFQGTQLVYIDVYSTFLNIVQHPQIYGFEESTIGCCGTGFMEVGFLCNSITSIICPDASKYVFWDSYHPTERTYKIIVDRLIKRYIRFFS